MALAGLRSLHTFDAFRDHSYRRLWVGNFFSYISRWMQMTLLVWLVLELTDSPFLVALVGFFAMGPMLLLGIFGGVLADRIDKRKLLITTQTSNLVAVAAMALILFTGNIQYWHAYLVILVSGTGWALDMPSRRSLVIDMLGKARMTNAIALDSIGMHSSRMLGPALGGLLISLVDVKGGYVVITLFYVMAVIMISTVRVPQITRRPAAAVNILRNLYEGFKYVRSSNVMMAVILTTIFMNFLLFPYMQMVPVIARDILHVGPGLMGVLMAAEGFGALTGAIMIASANNLAHHGRVYFGGSMLGLFMLLLFALSHWYAVSLGVMLVLGLGTAGFGTMQGTIIMLVSREDMRGRALGVMTLAIGAGPLGALMVGAVANVIGAPSALILNAIVGILTVGAIGLFMPSLRGRMIPDGDEEPVLASDPQQPVQQKAGVAD